MLEVLGFAGTIAAFSVAKQVQARTSSAFANPTLMAILVIGGVLLLTGVDYGDYKHATSPLAFLLGPAVVALAIPLHQERATLLAHTRLLLTGAVTGAVAAMALGYGASVLLHFDDQFSLAVTTRTATSPISIAIADELGRPRGLSAVMTIVGGIFGATFAPALMDRLGVREPVARGLAMGVTAHGIGTARMLQESRVAGATSSVGMGLGGLVVALVVPGLW